MQVVTFEGLQWICEKEMNYEAYESKQF